MPHRYQIRLSEHLKLMREEDFEPREAVDVVLKVVITGEKMPGEIMLNVDTTPINKSALITKFHVKTAA